jgi:glutamate 5-kinase
MDAGGIAGDTDSRSSRGAQGMQRVVVKLGTSTLTGGALSLNRQRMLEIILQIAHLHRDGLEVLLVSSGAQFAGREVLRFPDLGKSLPAKQMLSAVGQSHLMGIYHDLFDIFSIVVAQVLLTRDDFSHRRRYLNARDTLNTLIEHGIIPIINENDTTAMDELRVGDNDNLSALVASTMGADLLLLLTDQRGLYTADPRTNPDAQLIPLIEKIDDRIEALAGGAGFIGGTGGMATKVQAAQTATRSGVPVVIADGRIENVVVRVVGGESLGTRFEAAQEHLRGRKRFVLTGRPEGALVADGGAVRVLQRGTTSLLPVGILAVEGRFDRGAMVVVRDAEGTIVARGLSSYASADIRRLAGQKSAAIPDILGYSYGDAVIHRNNLVLS